VAVLLAAAASALLAPDRVGMRVVGRVPEGLPVPAVPAITLGDIALLLPAALGDRSGLVVYRYDAPLCFANAENLRNRALAVLDVEPATRWLLLNMEAVIEIDLTAADAVHQLCDELDARGVIPAMARVKQDLLPDLRAGGLVDRIGAERIFPTLPTAVAAFRDQQSIELPPSSP
jgi:MFS superfamily sulfate permease-like transporter